MQEQHLLTGSGTAKRLADRVEFRLYGPETDAGLEWVLVPSLVSGPTLTCAPGDPDPAWNEMSVWLSICRPGMHTHVPIALDDHAEDDKDHRQRWALQRGAAVCYPRATTYDTTGHTPAGPYAVRRQRWLADGTAYVASSCHRNPTPASTLADAMAQSHLFMVLCRGNPGGGVMHLDDPASGDLARTVYGRRAVPGEAGTFLEGLDLTSELVVVLWLCYSAYKHPVHGKLTAEAVASGAQCAVGFTGPVTAGDPGEKPQVVWTDAFWQALTVGKWDDGTPADVDSAVDYAADRVKAQFGQYLGTNTVDVGGDGALKVAPAR